jgi:hypothetical protein
MREITLNVYASSDSRKAPLCKTYVLTGSEKVMPQAKPGTTSRLHDEDLERLQALLLAEAKKRGKRDLEVVALRILADRVHAARRYADIMATGKNKAHRRFDVRAQLAIA